MRAQRSKPAGSGRRFCCLATLRGLEFVFLHLVQSVKLVAGSVIAVKWRHGVG
jgi:hypothetical protein